MTNPQKAKRIPFGTLYYIEKLRLHAAHSGNEFFGEAADELSRLDKKQDPTIDWVHSRNCGCTQCRAEAEQCNN
jgi:hypothetical protein